MNIEINNENELKQYNQDEYEKLVNEIKEGANLKARDWAWIYYHVFGWHILPGYKGKKNSYLKWTTSGYEFKRYPWKFLDKAFRKPNVTNILLVAGKLSNVTVVDDDSKKKETISHKAGFLLSELKPTLISITGSGGKHHFYKFIKEFPDMLGIENCIDIRNQGLIVLPPSIHENGNMYEWEDIDAYLI